MQNLECSEYNPYPVISNSGAIIVKSNLISTQIFEIKRYNRSLNEKATWIDKTQMITKYPFITKVPIIPGKKYPIRNEHRNPSIYIKMIARQRVPELKTL